MPNVVQYIRHGPAHILVQNRRDRPRRFYGMGEKVRKNFEFFTISRLYVHISQKLLKIEAYKQCMQKRFIPPLSNCRICMDQSLTGFYRVGQKLSDVLPVLRITPRATEPSTVSVFLSSVKCGRICRAVVKIDCSKRLAFLLYDFKLMSNQQQLISKTDTYVQSM